MEKILNLATECRTFDVEDDLSKVFSYILKEGRGAVITKDGKYYGVIGEKLFRDSNVSNPKVKCQSFAESAPQLLPSDEFSEVVKKFDSSGSKDLPVVDRRGCVVACVSRDSLLAFAVANDLIPDQPLESLKRPRLVTVSQDAPISSLKSEMRRNSVRRVVVVGGDGELRGIVSAYDIGSILLSPKSRDMQSLPKQLPTLETLKVREFMKPNVVSIQSDKSLKAAARKMVEHRVSSVVIMAGAKPAGIVTFRDIIKHLAVKSGPQVSIIGLGKEDRELYPVLEQFGMDIAEKASKLGKLDNVELHFKKKQHNLEIHLHVNADEQLRFSAQGFKLDKVLSDLKREFKNLVSKRKK